ncbi:MAG: class I mannose-6-phosphate isomerase [Clostridia bacterium]|nr:class I mannose-6-phosphate isomerase [Clostridia bacterium]
MDIMKMGPKYRYGESTPWGGDNLRLLFGKDAPEDRVGESLEVSALKDLESVILNGQFAGQTLTDALEADYEGLTGTDKKPFPLLLKLLDARETLSVQVHPGDEYASVHDGKLGKTEAWMVLSAEPGSRIAYGLKPTDEPLDEIVKQGRFEEALNWVYPRPGEVYYIPHGCVHALGGGVMVYEIQQSSDATYRFWDWGRVGKDGKPRELHTQKALDVTRPGLHLDKVAGATILCEGGSRTHYVCDENFALMRLNVCGRMPLSFRYMAFITPAGPCKVGWEGGEMELEPFSTALIPASCRGAYVEGRLPVMCSTLPEQEELRKELGYRAENVAGLG